jgi:hypothetical protein
MYEREGFYLQNQWFTSLTDNIIVLVLQLLNGSNRNVSCSPHEKLLDYMLKLYHTNSPTRFQDLCSFILCIARFVPDMKASLPPWVYMAAGEDD